MPYFVRLALVIGLDSLWGGALPALVEAFLAYELPFNLAQLRGTFHQAGRDIYQIFWLLLIVSQFVWFWCANKQSVSTARRAWWLIAGGVWVVGLSLVVFEVWLFRLFGLSGVGFLMLCSLLLIDILVLFWFPTVLLAPAAQRLTPPGARFLALLTRID